MTHPSEEHGMVVTENGSMRKQSSYERPHPDVVKSRRVQRKLQRKLDVALGYVKHIETRELVRMHGTHELRLENDRQRQEIGRLRRELHDLRAEMAELARRNANPNDPPWSIR